MNDQTESLRQISCADDYDPNSMPVAKAREVIGRFLSPVATSNACTSAPRWAACWRKT